MQGFSVLSATSDLLRGGGSSWRVYRTSIAKKSIILISRSTIAKMFSVPTTAVQKFIIHYNLPTFEVSLMPPRKRKQMTLTLLSVAVHYWKYLYRRGQLSHLPTRTDERWQKFMADCEALPDDSQALKSVPDYPDAEQLQAGTLIECFVESVGKLAVVVDHEGQYWIPPQSGLSVINAPIEWLSNELKSSSKKNRILRQRGFSGKYYQHVCKSPEGNLCRLTTLSFEDWLTIWAYFALHRNQKALALLKGLAQKSLATFLLEKNQELDNRVASSSQLLDV